VKASVATYLSYHAANEQERKENYVDLINKYYDLVTDFYEWGWGQSFHFALRHSGENFHASIARAEFWLSSQLGLKPGMNVLDVGCGIGGPARAIARFSGCNIVGVNNNEYQIERARKQTKAAFLDSQVTFVKGDFMNLPFPDNHFDALYQIEATAHAPDKEKCYAELFRVLKPGGVFGSYEWCLTDKFEPENRFHLKVKKGIEEGDALPDIATINQVVEAMKKVGFELLLEEDRGKKLSPNDIPWYQPLVPKYNILNFHHTEIGSKLSHYFLRTLESVRIVSSGSSQVQQFLHTAAVNLVLGGELDIFTPSYFTLAKKPE